jgi:hypothetical protein
MIFREFVSLSSHVQRPARFGPQAIGHALDTYRQRFDIGRHSV